MMKSGSIVFLETDNSDKTAVLLRFPNAVCHGEALEGDSLVAACKDAEVVSTFIYSRFTADVLRQLPALKLLVTRSVGTDHIDLEACAKQGIAVCTVPDYGSHVIAEHVFALLLSTLRHIPEGNARTERGMFDYHGLRGMALKGKTIAIIGAGKIGSRVARIAHGFDMTILAVDVVRSSTLERAYGVRYVTLQEALTAADIVTLHAPELTETHHMIDAHAFAQMKPGVVLVNTARGTLIDSAALLAALQSGTVRHALLDVLEHETNFQENKELITHPNVVTTPHIAFYADDSMRAMYDDCFHSIDEWLAGKEPQHMLKASSLRDDSAAMKMSGKSLTKS